MITEKLEVIISDSGLIQVHSVDESEIRAVIIGGDEKANAQELVKRWNCYTDLLEAVTKWPRCCDQWQDGLGGMHCKHCSQKTFTMFAEVQRILGINKAGNAIAKAEKE